MKIIDMHCHILPGIDDGAKDEAMSLDMIKMSVEQNVDKIMLTPHYYLGKTKHDCKELEERFQDFKGKVNVLYPDLKLYLGTEILWADGVTDALKNEKIHPLGDTRYVLVEFFPSASYNVIYGALRELVQNRYRPVIAHVERYICLQKHLDRIEEMIENGAYLQMNADSLTGSIFDGNVKWCRKLMLGGYISVLGTDAHNLEDRAPCFEDAVNWMQKKMSQQDIQAVLHENAEKIINNEWL